MTSSDYQLTRILIRYLLELNKEHKMEYVKRVSGMADNAGFTVCDSNFEYACVNMLSLSYRLDYHYQRTRLL